MFIKIPFESIVDFKTNISEITKMSLEHDFFVNDGVVLGNFYVSGEYKAHEVSINTESFKYTLPFTVELREDIKKDSLEFNIEDFNYEVVDNNKLKVNIEYSLTAEVEEELFERVNEEELTSELAFIDDFLDSQESVEEKEEEKEEETRDNLVLDEPETPMEKVVDLEEKEEVKKETIVPKEVTLIKEVEVPAKTDNLEETNEKEEDKEERLTLEEEKTVMETIQSSDDTFVTYHIHIVKESETKESICALYNVSSALIDEYNELDSLSIGDKIIIPKVDE